MSDDSATTYAFDGEAIPTTEIYCILDALVSPNFDFANQPNELSPVG